MCYFVIFVLILHSISMLKTFFIIQFFLTYRATLDISIYRIIEIVEMYPNIFSFIIRYRNKSYNSVVETRDG